jgi:hypothetical protein
MSKLIESNSPEYLRKQTIYMGKSIELLHRGCIHHLEGKTLQKMWDVFQEDKYIQEWTRNYQSIKEQTIRALINL